MILLHLLSFFFFFNDTATTEIYTLSLHDALPIYVYCRNFTRSFAGPDGGDQSAYRGDRYPHYQPGELRSEEHTSELQSQSNLVCRLLLEKKKKNKSATQNIIQNQKCGD